MFVDIWRTHQLIGLLACAILFCFLVSQTLGKSYALALLYSLASAIWIFQNPKEAWPGLQAQIDGSSANAAVVLLLISAVVAYFREDDVWNFFKWCYWIVLLNCLSVIAIGHGIFNAGSMDTAVAALFVPAAIQSRRGFQFRRYQGWLPAVVLLGAIAANRGATAFAMLFVMGLVQFFYSKRKGLVLAFCAVVLAGGISVMLFRHVHTDDRALWNWTSGRIQNWQEMFAWWGPHANHYLGTGTGTYVWISPAITLNSRHDFIFLWMHNEYLQALFEQGFIGLSLFLLVGVSALVKSASNQWLFTTFAGLSVFCLTQYPFRFFLTQFVIVCLVRLAQEKGPSAQLPTGQKDFEPDKEL